LVSETYTDADPNPAWWRSVLNTDEWVKCETCGVNNAIGVAAVPGVPYSAAYCASCIKANAHPWWLVVANTADIGGLDDAADWWVEIVEATCTHLGKTMDEFNREVAQAINDDQPS
jgi:hypothetical protein